MGACVKPCAYSNPIPMHVNRIINGKPIRKFSTEIFNFNWIDSIQFGKLTAKCVWQWRGAALKWKKKQEILFVRFDLAKYPYQIRNTCVCAFMKILNNFINCNGNMWKIEFEFSSENKILKWKMPTTPHWFI